MNQDIIFVFVEDYPDWESAEVLYFLAALGKGRYNIQVAGITLDPIRAISGVSIVPDCTVEDPTAFCGLVLVGGLGWTNQIRERIALVRPLVTSALDNNCSLGAIGTGVDILGTFGLLNNIVHTGNSSAEISVFSELNETSTPYTGSSLFEEAGAVRNGNIVTARNISGLAFARAFMWTLDIDQGVADKVYDAQEIGASLPIINEL